jgi:hypothetical protein
MIVNCLLSRARESESAGSIIGIPKVRLKRFVSKLAFAVLHLFAGPVQFIAQVHGQDLHLINIIGGGEKSCSPRRNPLFIGTQPPPANPIGCLPY